MPEGTRTRRRPEFHPLPVAAVDRLTDDALALTFDVPPYLRDTFAFQAGQHLTVRPAGAETGAQVRRSYSICSTPHELARHGRLRIGVKQLPGGVFSEYAATLAAGDRVPVLPPVGRFTTRFDPARARRYVGVVAGSGITPVLSLAATALATEPASRFTVFYGNRYARSVMFAEDLADLKDRWPDRLHVVHVLSQEPQQARLLSGRIDAGRLPELLAGFLPGPAAGVDEWFLCGPYGMVCDAREALAAAGVAAGTVRAELFHVPTGGQPAPERLDHSAAQPGEVELTVRLDGRQSRVTMRYGERVLDAALRARGELPYSCRGGVCSTCRARVTEGEVRMVSNWALEPDELADGYVLTCQSLPVTDQVAVDYDT